MAAVHAEVCQAGKGGELKSVDIKRTILGAAFKMEMIWRKMKREYPENIQPVKLMSVDDSRAPQWLNDVKTNSINTGLVLDQETHHDLLYQCGCRRSVKFSCHVTGVYATNAAGDVLPPMLIFDSNGKTDENFCVKNSWLEGLPTISGQCGSPSTLIEWASFFDMRSKGSMDDSQQHSYIEDVLLPLLYPNICKTASFDATDKLLVAGPAVVLKLDWVQVVVASHESILKREGYFKED
ncbi:hypothetical protein MHU86_8338 [Fragilaria crotonensis]|nr:hypothetical protein MHU86_8338 [Fragilaria crotonensis]